MGSSKGAAHRSLSRPANILFSGSNSLGRKSSVNGRLLEITAPNISMSTSSGYCFCHVGRVILSTELERGLSFFFCAARYWAFSCSRFCSCFASFFSLILDLDSSSAFCTWYCAFPLFLRTFSRASCKNSLSLKFFERSKVTSKYSRGG